MKNFVSIAMISLFIASHARANCLENYESSLKTPKIKTTIEAQFGEGPNSNTAAGTLMAMTHTGLIITGAATFGLTGAAGGLLIIPAIAFTSIGVENVAVGVSNIKEKQMIALIKDSYKFKESRVLPGKALKKLSRQLNRSQKSISIEDLANTIITSNENETLCSQNNLSMREVKRAIRSGELSIVEH